MTVHVVFSFYSFIVVELLHYRFRNVALLLRFIVLSFKTYTFFIVYRLSNRLVKHHYTETYRMSTHSYTR